MKGTTSWCCLLGAVGKNGKDASLLTLHFSVQLMSTFIVALQIAMLLNRIAVRGVCGWRENLHKIDSFLANKKLNNSTRLENGIFATILDSFTIIPKLPYLAYLRCIPDLNSAH